MARNCPNSWIPIRVWGQGQGQMLSYIVGVISEVSNLPGRGIKVTLATDVQNAELSALRSQHQVSVFHLFISLFISHLQVK